jgi:hypothetical protein
VDAVGDAEGQVEIGPAIAAAERKRADLRARDDALVRMGELQDALADSVSILDGKQAQR